MKVSFISIGSNTRRSLNLFIDERGFPNYSLLFRISIYLVEPYLFPFLEPFIYFVWLSDFWIHHKCINKGFAVNWLRCKVVSACWSTRLGPGPRTDAWSPQCLMSPDSATTGPGARRRRPACCSHITGSQGLNAAGRKTFQTMCFSFSIFLI